MKKARMFALLNPCALPQPVPIAPAIICDADFNSNRIFSQEIFVRSTNIYGTFVVPSETLIFARERIPLLYRIQPGQKKLAEKQIDPSQRQVRAKEQAELDQIQAAEAVEHDGHG